MLNLNLKIQSNIKYRDEISTLSHPDQLQSWISYLPVFDVGTTADMLLEVITFFNQKQLDTELRYSLLNILHTPVKESLQALKKKSRHASMPLPERKLNNSQIAQDLLHEFANGFKIIASEISGANNIAAVKNAKLICSVYFAIQYASQSLLEYYLLYSEIPAGLWNDIHQLYAYAEKYKFAEKKIKSADSNTIHHLYKRIVMLALANPYHLLQDEAEKIYSNLDTWVQGCKISHLGTLSPSGKCIVELSEDKPPQQIRACKGWNNVRHPDARIIDASSLINQLKIYIEDSLSKNAEARSKNKSTLSTRNQRNLCTRLLEAWSIRKERLAERTQSVKNIVMAAGLSATHYYVNGEVPFTSVTINTVEGTTDNENKPDNCLSGLSLVPLNDTTYENDGGINNMAVSGTHMETNFNNNSTADNPWNSNHTDVIRTEQNEKHPSYITNMWTQKNRSTGGLALYCNIATTRNAVQQNESRGGAALSFSHDANLKVHVGDIVAYKDTLHVGADWKIGSIRWIKVDSTGQMDLGIKKFTSLGKAVASKAIKGVGKGGDYFRALLISKSVEKSTQQTLITSSVVYDVGTVLQLKSDQGIQNVKLTRILEATASFTHYEYLPVK